MIQQKKPNQSLDDVLERLAFVIKRDINCMKIGQVQSFNAENQTASVEISVSRVINVNADGTKIVRKFPLLVDVPCFVLSGGGSFIEMPIANGDFCILLFSDEDLDGWIVNNESTPESLRRHDLSDAICLVGLTNYPNSLAFDQDGIKIRFSDTSYIRINGDGATIEGDLTVSGKTNLSGTAGNVTVGGNPGVTGTANSSASVTFVNGIATAIT